MWAAVLGLALVGGGCSSGSDGDASSDEPSGDATTTTTAPVAEDLGEPGAIVIAHRGASAYAPEHSFAGYDLALEQGADYLEQDLQLTSDGVLVVLHDGTLDRTASGPAEACTGAVGDKTAAQIEECELGTKFNEANPDLADPAFAAERIPTMEAVLERYQGKARYYIEVKAPEEQPGIEDALLDLLDDAELAAPAPGLPPVIIQSFSAESLQRIHERRPELPLVLLIRATDPEPDDAALAEIATYADAIGPSFLMVDSSLVEAAHARCLDVHPYTIDDPDVMAGLLADGVGGFFTNRPDVGVAQRDAGPPDEGTCTPQR